MASAFLFPPNSTTLKSPTTKPSFRIQFSTQNPYLHFSSHQRKTFPFLVSASSPTSSSPINVDYFRQEFNGHGVTFESLGDECVVKMSLENGSLASMMLPSGLITSYKPQLWHGSTAEVLQTSVEVDGDGEAVVFGGVSVGFRFGSELDGGGLSWSPTTWALLDVKGSSDDFVQVELISVDPESTIEVKYTVTLRENLLGSELTVKNMKSTSIQAVGFVLSHLKVSTPEATYAFGLQGSNYQSRKPLQTGFSIIPPDLKKPKSSSSQMTLQDLFSGWGTAPKKHNKELKVEEEEEEGEEEEGEVEDDSLQMSDKFSRFYTYAPREFTVLDRGRRNSVIVERRGFDEFYMFSPGSDHEWYGRYAYVCVGPSAMLMPVDLGPQQVWYGSQFLHNPNL